MWSTCSTKPMSSGTAAASASLPRNSARAAASSPAFPRSCNASTNKPTPKEVRELSRTHTGYAVNRLVFWMNSDDARISGANAGKASGGKPHHRVRGVDRYKHGMLFLGQSSNRLQFLASRALVLQLLCKKMVTWK